jgi:hypothetical protein
VLADHPKRRTGHAAQRTVEDLFAFVSAAL